MPQPNNNSIHVDTPLTNLSVAFFQDARNFVAGRVFPTVASAFRSDRYYTYDRGEFNRDEMTKRAPATESAGGDYTVDNTPSFYCDIWSMHKDIADEDAANADVALNLRREASVFLAHKALIRREADWASTFFANGVWTYGRTGVAASPTAGTEVLQWNDAASTPIEDIREGVATVLESTGMVPNTLVLGYRVYKTLLDHPDIVDRIKYGQTPGSPALANEQILAQIFDVERVLVMRAISNSANEGATASHAFIGGKHALLCYVPDSPGLYTPAAGYTFAWNGYMGAAGDGMRVTRFYMEQIRAERVEIEMAIDHKLVAPDLGFFWTTVIA